MLPKERETSILILLTISQDMVIPWMDQPCRAASIVTEAVESFYGRFEKEEIHNTMKKLLEITLGTDNAYFSSHPAVSADIFTIFLKHA